MRKRPSLAAMLLLVSLAVLAACTPQAAPAPISAPAPVPTAAPVAPAAPQPTSPGDAEMQQLIKAAQQEGKLVMYDATFFVGDIRVVVAKAFQERYGIPMEILVSGGSSATIEKLQVEQRMGVNVADLFIAGSISGPRMISLGLTKEIASQLPVLKKDKAQFILDPTFSPGGEAITFAYILIGVAANNKLVQPGEIKSYKDLMNPKFKGKIIMRDPRLGSGGSPLTLGTFRHLKVLNDEFLGNLAKQQQVAMWGGGEAEVAQMLARGEYLVDMAAGLGLLYGPLIRDGAPLMPVYMEEGTAVMPSLIMASKGAPHPNAARLFINWLLSSEGQSVYHKVDASTPIRKDVADFMPEGMRKEPVKKLLPMNWEISQALLKMIAGKDFEKVFGAR